MLALDQLQLSPLAAPPLFSPASVADDGADSQFRDILLRLSKIFAGYCILIFVVANLRYCIRRWTDRVNPNRPSGDIEMAQPSGSLRRWHVCPYQLQQVAAVATADAETVIYRRSADSRKFSCDECVICLGTFEEGEECWVLKNCNHEYHKNCIKEWLIRDRNCPLCRSSVRVGRPLRPPPPASATSNQTQSVRVVYVQSTFQTDLA